jgi:hypothetical protein
MREPKTTMFFWLLRLVMLACATMLCLCVTAHGQSTIHIPADVRAIQSAIDAASDGDTLLVAPGTYFENLNFRGKAITLRSSEGPAVTILDGRDHAPVITFATGETRASTVSGFTLRNGAPASPASHGGGVLLVASSPTLEGNILTQNLCAALDATDAAPLLTRNILRETQPSPLCAAQPVAAAIFHGGTPTLLNNIIERNDLTAATPIAAGIAVLDAHAILQGNIVRYNLTGNDAPSAILIEGPTQSTLFQQNLIYANTSRCGPAVSFAAAGELLNNTVADNVSCSSSAEVSLSSQYVLVANNILAASAGHPALSCATLPELHHNLLHNTAGPILAGACQDPGTNLLTDPLFASRASADYHLSPHSPALAEGTTAIALPQRDLDDTPRTRNGHIDLGPYEHAAPRALAASTTSLTATPNPAEAFEALILTAQVTTQNATPTGSVTFTANAQSLATALLDADGRASFTTTTLAAATYTLAATYNGSDALAPSSSTLTRQIAPATALLSFAVTPSTADETQSVTLSATVQAPLSTQIPSGQVQFLELTTKKVLATIPLDVTGHATTTLATMPTGTWLVDAAYLGTPNFAPVTLPASNALTLAIAARGYILAATTPTVSIQSGHHAPVALTLTSVGTFAASITLSCGNLPANATCAFSPASATLTAGATAPVTLTLDTDAVPGFLSLAHPVAAPTLALLAFLGFKRRRRAAATLCLLAGLTGCTSKYPAQVPSGTYTIQVISQAAGSSSPQIVSLTLLVTN